MVIVQTVLLLSLVICGIIALSLDYLQIYLCTCGIYTFHIFEYILLDKALRQAHGVHLALPKQKYSHVLAVRLISRS